MRLKIFELPKQGVGKFELFKIFNIALRLIFKRINLSSSYRIFWLSKFEQDDCSLKKIKIWSMKIFKCITCTKFLVLWENDHMINMCLNLMLYSLKSFTWKTVNFILELPLILYVLINLVDFNVYSFLWYGDNLSRIKFYYVC